MFALWFEHRAAIQYGAIIALAMACWIWGRGPERLAACVLVSMPFAEVGYHLALGPGTRLTHTDFGHAVMQVIFAIPLLGIALFANRSYPLWLAAFQIVVVLTHAIRNLLPATGGPAYLLLTVGPSYGMIVALAMGLAAHRWREHRSGPYRSWRT